MTSPYRIERDRGAAEARQQLAVLRVKWPLAFPVQHQDVRPLAMGVARQVAPAIGWSLPYTLGVLGRWKMAAVYCQAVLCHDQRIALDGTPAETVDAEAKDLAAKQLTKLAARKAVKESREARGPHGGEAEACPGAANRDARGITRPSACSAVASARIAARKTVLKSRSGHNVIQGPEACSAGQQIR
jgi:sRNA-binding protein